MNSRPKIASLNEKELAELLITSFFKIGRSINLPGERLKTFMEEVYKFQGWMYVDTFSDAFSRYAAVELPEAENLRPYVSPMFISRLMKLYFKKCNDKKFITNPVKNKITVLTAGEKYALFIQFITVNKRLPGNADWVMIYEHHAGLKNLSLPEDWETMPYQYKWKHALNTLTEWAYKSYKL